MIDRKAMIEAYRRISLCMKNQRDYLIELDQRNGDGDLGISMDNGFQAALDAMIKSESADLGLLLRAAARAFNEKAPSSLGTILSIGMMGMAKTLKGKDTCSISELADAMNAGIDSIIDKAGSKPGEKTILDALVPAVSAMKKFADDPTVMKKVQDAALQGAESTKEMRSVHGRAAYYGDQSIGIVDGGAIAASLIFKALAE